MSDQTESVSCDRHGESYATFVCQHLALAYGQGYYYAEDDADDDPCPDAWCYRCDCLLMQRGDWDEESEAFADIKLLCAGCYHEARDRNELRSGAADLDGWELGTRDQVTAFTPSISFPTSAELEGLDVGSMVKILIYVAYHDEVDGECLQGERMWVSVESMENGRFAGRLASMPVTEGTLASGEYLEFHAEQIIEISAS